LLAGLELAVPGTTDPLPPEQVNQVIAEAQKRGVLVGKNTSTVKRLECVITLAPPLVATDADIERIVDVLDAALGMVKA
jgi:taurine-pyruvate aminotransferase